MLTVSVFGSVEAHRDPDLLPVPSRKSTELLTRLAMEPGSTVRTDLLVDDLWADAAGRNTPDWKVSQLRRALGDRAWKAASLLGLCVAVLIMVTAQPATAHGNPGNYVTTITSVQPAVPGLSASVESDGSFLTIVNRTGGTVIVMGYEQEAYLKITAHAVWRNSVSPTGYLNQGRSKDEIPAGLSTSAEPVWDQVSGSNTYRYHDHRIDWMGSGRPAVVSSNVNTHHLIKNWSIDLLVDGAPVTIHGTLSWSPNGFGPGEWLLVVVGLVLMVGILIAMAAERHRAGLQI